MASPWELAQDDPHYMRLGEYLAAKLTSEEMTRLQATGEVSREGLEEEFLRDPWEELDIRKVVDPQFFARPFVLVVSLRAKDHSTCPLHKMVKENSEVHWGKEEVTVEMDTEGKIDERKDDDHVARGRYKNWEEHEKGKRIQGIFKWKQHLKQEAKNASQLQEVTKTKHSVKVKVDTTIHKCKEPITPDIKKMLLTASKSKVKRKQKGSEERNKRNEILEGSTNQKPLLSEKPQERKKVKKIKETEKKLTLVKCQVENTKFEQRIAKAESSSLTKSLKRMVISTGENICLKKLKHDNQNDDEESQKKDNVDNYEEAEKEYNSGNDKDNGDGEDRNGKYSDGKDGDEKECDGEARGGENIDGGDNDEGDSDEEDSEEIEFDQELSADESEPEEESDTEEEGKETDRHEEDHETEESDCWPEIPSDYEDPFWDTLQNTIAKDVDEERKNEPDSDSSYECEPSDQCPFTARMDGGGCKKCRRKDQIYSRMARMRGGGKKSNANDIDISKLSVNDQVQKRYVPMDQDPSCVHRHQVRVKSIFCV